MAIEPDRLEAFMGRFATDQAAAMHAATVVLGHQLGLYAALAAAGPATGEELAQRTGCAPRLVVEWLRSQALSDYCAHDPATGTYRLTEEQAACLADADGPTFLAGGLATVSAVHRGIDRVADVACGFGTTTLLLAEAFPAASVSGFDSHEVSIAAARRAAAEAGVADRVTFEVADATRLPGSGYDLVCICNALHEMGDPVGACRRVRDVLADDGVLMLVEPNAGDTDEANRTPVGRSFASASTMVCLPSAISQGGTWHLGAQAPDAEFEAVADEAGFARCRRVAETPLHRVLELTP